MSFNQPHFNVIAEIKDFSKYVSSFRNFLQTKNLLKIRPSIQNNTEVTSRNWKYKHLNIVRGEPWLHDILHTFQYWITYTSDSF